MKIGAPTLLHSSFLGIGVVSMAINLLMLTGPLFMLQIYDRILPSQSTATLVTLLVLVAVLYVYFAVLEWLRSKILIRVAMQFYARWSGPAFVANVNLPMRIGVKSKGLSPVDDVERIRQFLSSSGPAALFDMPWMPIYLGLVFLLHPTLGWLGLFGAMLTLGLIFVQDRLTGNATGNISESGVRYGRLSMAARLNGEPLSAMGMLPNLAARWHEAADEFLGAQRAVADRTAAFSAAIRGWRFALQSAVLALGAYLAINSELSPGGIVAASILVSRALAPVDLATIHWRGFVACRQSLKRLAKVLASLPEAAPQIELPLPSHSLEVKDAAIAAPGSRAVPVRGLNFVLKAGDGLGIVGPTGGGKSTLGRGLVGVWPVANGEIRLDGSTLDQWSHERLGKAIGYLPQTVNLFDGTIADNISRFEGERDTDAVIAAARLADVHDLIVKFSNGYDTEVGEHGELLSIGQRQRIGLARALYRRPFLIVLDEPNSNLDGAGENALARAMTTMRRLGSIVIVIAHRPSAIAAVDQLLVVQDGRQARIGPKAEILGTLSGRGRGRGRRTAEVDNSGTLHAVRDD